MDDWLLKFYRIKKYNDKFSWLKFLTISLLGWATAKYSLYNPLNLIFLLIGVSGIFMHAYSLNALADFKYYNEKNVLYKKIKGKKITFNKALILSILPLILFSVFFLFNQFVILFALLFLIITDFYSLKPLRLKNQFFWGVFSVPICAVVLYLQGVLALSLLNLNHVFLAIFVFFFLAFGESVHKLYHKEKDKTIEILGKRGFIKIVRSFPLITLVLSLIFACYTPIFYISTLFSAIRFIKIRNINEKTNFRSFRKKFFTKSFSIEFLFYLIFGFFGFF